MAGICGICSGPILEVAVICSRCATGFHPVNGCTGLSPNAIHCIVNESQSGIQYVCTGCRCASPSGEVDPGGLTQIYIMIKSLASSVAALTSQVSNIVSNPNNTLPASAPASGPALPSSSALYAEFREFEERKKRVSSLIVRGFSDITDADFRRKFSDVCQTLINSNPSLTSVVCINRGRGMFRVNVPCRTIKQQLLTEANKLKNHPSFSNIFISRDLTFKQREELKLRRQNLRSDGNNGSLPPPGGSGLVADTAGRGGAAAGRGGAGGRGRGRGGSGGAVPRVTRAVSAAQAQSTGSAVTPSGAGDVVVDLGGASPAGPIDFGGFPPLQ